MYGVGAFTGKIKLGDIIKDMELPMRAVAVILKIGELKYPSYSWYNNYTDPKADSTVECNINAMLRHFTAHRMGFCVDPDSKMPHIFHLACRAALLTTTYYLDTNAAIGYKRNLLKPCSYEYNNSLGLYITGEVLTSLSKTTNSIDKINCNTRLEVLLNDLLYRASTDGIKKMEDPIHEVTLVDAILRTTFSYVKDECKTVFMDDFVKNIDETQPKEIAEYLHQFLG